MLVVGERLVEARWKHRAELLIEIGDAELDALRLPHQYVDLLNGLLERVQFGEVDGGQIAGLIGQVLSLVLEHADLIVDLLQRSEERRVGKGCVSTCRSRWSPYD